MEKKVFKEVVEDHEQSEVKDGSGRAGAAVKRRCTKQRKLVLDVVKSRCDHPTADQIYLDVRKADSRISRGTVYRNLNCLAEEGEILHVKVTGANRYDSRIDQHYHLICRECGNVIDVPVDYLADIDKSVAEQTGCEVVQHRMMFEGYCPACAAARKGS